MTIAPIQTRYGGVLYRSRTEARWALWFDLAGIRFDYEAEGFVIRSGAYLPDFWLRDLRMFLEVKGQEPTEEEAAKCAELCIAAECDVLLVVGNPEERFQVHWFDRSGRREGVYAWAVDAKQQGLFWLVSEDHAQAIGPGLATDQAGPVLSPLVPIHEAARSERFGRETKRTRRSPIDLDLSQLAEAA